jgi:hypothetical protein
MDEHEKSSRPTFGFRASVPLVKAVRSASRRLGMTPSETVRVLVMDGLKTMGLWPPQEGAK